MNPGKITINIDRNTTYKELMSLGSKGDTFDDILKRVIKVYKNVEQNPKGKKLIEVAA